jgi:hypothetical protein
MQHKRLFYYSFSFSFSFFLEVLRKVDEKKIKKGKETEKQKGFYI